MQRLLATVALAAVALVAAACGTSNAGQPAAPAASIDPSAPAITAKDIKFVQSEVQVPAGKPFKLTFDNQESAPHNVAIYTDASAGQALFQGEIFSGATRVYQVPALAAGSYFFRCDVHPDMTGTIVAS
jgi:plastocyanin